MGEIVGFVVGGGGECRNWVLDFCWGRFFVVLDDCESVTGSVPGLRARDVILRGRGRGVGNRTR